jgi:hypothetical protein
VKRNKNRLNSGGLDKKSPEFRNSGDFLSLKRLSKKV